MFCVYSIMVVATRQQQDSVQVVGETIFSAAGAERLAGSVPSLAGLRPTLTGLDAQEGMIKGLDGAATALGGALRGLAGVNIIRLGLQMIAGPLLV